MDQERSSTFQALEGERSVAHETSARPAFGALNRGYAQTFQPGKLSLGLVVPIQAYGRAPSTDHPVQMVQLAESLGFRAVWLRDVPFDVPSFGDPGQIFDPFVQLGALSVSTSDIALGVASVILPLRHPAHVAKAAASVDLMSQGRLLLGIASGDRPDEYPALGVDYHTRGERFRASYAYIRAMSSESPSFDNPLGILRGQMDMLPKPHGTRIPLLITGSSQQDSDWVAQHGDGWMTYPRPPALQTQAIEQYRGHQARLRVDPKPVMQSLYLDLDPSPSAPLSPIHLGYRGGIDAVVEHLLALAAGGVNHVALNLRFNRANLQSTLKEISREILPVL